MHDSSLLLLRYRARLKALCPGEASSPLQQPSVLRAQLQQGPLVAAAAPQPTVGSEVRWWRDAAAKHPLHLPPLCNPSPEFSIPGAAASHPAAASPALRCASSPACILPVAAGGCSPLVLSFLALSFPASPCAAGWEWYSPPSSSRCSVDIARR